MGASTDRGTQGYDLRSRDQGVRLQELECGYPAPAHPNRFVGRVSSLSPRYPGIPDFWCNLGELFDVNADEIAFAPCKGHTANDVFSNYFQQENVWQRAGGRNADPRASF